METLKRYSRVWVKITSADSFDTRMCKAFAKTLLVHTPSFSSLLPESIESKEAMIDKLNGKSCIDFLVKNLDSAIQKSLPDLQDNQCDNTLEVESIEIMKGIISKCFTTDRGIIVLENHFLFFQDAHTPEEKEAWFQETLAEWKTNIHSGMVEAFQSALRIWMIAQEEKS